MHWILMVVLMQNQGIATDVERVDGKWKFHYQTRQVAMPPVFQEFDSEDACNSAKERVTLALRINSDASQNAVVVSCMPKGLELPSRK